MNAWRQQLPNLRSRQGSETSCQSSPSWQTTSVSLKFLERKIGLGKGAFATTVGQSKAREPAGTCHAHPLQEVPTSAAAEPEQQFPEITLCVCGGVV